MAETTISWTDHSINPVRFGRGHYCQKISPGCANCYASRFQPRVGNPAFGGASSPLPLVIHNARSDKDLWFDPTKLRDVLRRKKPTRYFWCDMTDLFGSWVPDGWIDDCFATMALTPQHTHQVLTKRARRMAAYITQSWPLPNVWLGVSTEDQPNFDRRVRLLRQIPAAVRFLSVEPLLGPIDARGELDGIHWVIVGGESGPGARPCNLAWIRSLVAQCKAARTACFVKQVGSNPVWTHYTDTKPSNAIEQPYNATSHVRADGIQTRSRLHDAKGGDPEEWPSDLRVREFPAAFAAAPHEDLP